MTATMIAGTLAATDPLASLKQASWPHYEEDEIAAVTRILRSGRVNYWTGTEARSFEREYAAYVGVPYGVSLANGTVALELALEVLGIGYGDDVITSPRTFIASASCAVMRGARPIFADVDRDSQNITAANIERVLTPHTKAIIVVHLAGWPCEMDAITDLARSRNLAVIEDCAQANGATYQGRPVGAWGSLGAFSFCQDKIITTGGEGGMLVTVDEALWSSAWSFKDHGKGFAAAHRADHPVGFRWLHDSFGTNWRMTEMQAAIGRLQLVKLDDWVAKRRANAARLREALQDCAGLRIPQPGSAAHHAYYRFYAFVEPASLKAAWTRARVISEIAAQGVPCFEGSCSEVYLEHAFEGSASRPTKRLPVARELGETSLTFLVHPTLTVEHMARVGEVVRSVLAAAVR